MKKVITLILVVLLAVTGLYFLWGASGRTAVAAEPD